MLPFPEIEKPRVTEIQVRIDCNGCVQKIKRALYGINGIYDICVDLPQQKLTIIGWADPELLVKAIKKSRRTAMICPDPNQTPQPAEQPPPEGGQPPHEAAKPLEPPPTEASPPAEPPKDQPPPANPHPKPENQQGEADPNSKTKEVVFPHFGQDRDVFMISHQSNHGHRRPWVGQPVEMPAPFYLTHSYNTFTPSPYITEYFESPAKLTNYCVYGGGPGRDRHYNNQSISRVSQNIASVFSDENPHACGIM